MGWTPSIVPKGDDQNVYLVVDDLGRNGRVHREADIETADLETVIVDLISGQYKNPVRVVAFNTAEKWSQDVSAGVAHELRHRCDLQYTIFPARLCRSTRGPISRRATTVANAACVTHACPQARHKSAFSCSQRSPN
jgi:hypothetical protein